MRTAITGEGKMLFSNLSIFAKPAPYYLRYAPEARALIRFGTAPSQLALSGVEPLFAYYQNRANGDHRDWPADHREIPFDGNGFDGRLGWTNSWTFSDTTLTYHQSKQDKLWMEEMDLNYILRLEREGRLLELEPYADREIAHDHAFRKEIITAIYRARGEDIPEIKVVQPGSDSCALI